METEGRQRVQLAESIVDLRKFSDAMQGIQQAYEPSVAAAGMVRDLGEGLRDTMKDMREKGFKSTDAAAMIKVLEGEFNNRIAKGEPQIADAAGPYVSVRDGKISIDQDKLLDEAWPGRNKTTDARELAKTKAEGGFQGWRDAMRANPKKTALQTAQKGLSAAGHALNAGNAVVTGDLDRLVMMALQCVSGAIGTILAKGAQAAAGLDMIGQSAEQAVHSDSASTPGSGPAPALKMGPGRR